MDKASKMAMPGYVCLNVITSGFHICSRLIVRWTEILVDEGIFKFPLRRGLEEKILSMTAYISYKPVVIGA